MSSSKTDPLPDAEHPAAGSVKVMKFGGTSVGTPERLRTVAGVVARAKAEARVVVVVSAASRVTDRLAESLGEEAPAETIAFLAHRYTGLAEHVLEHDALTDYLGFLARRLSALERLFEIRRLLGACPNQDAEILAAGERMMAPLLAALLTGAGTPAHAVDAATLLETSEEYTQATVLLEPTITRVQAWFTSWPLGVVPVVTGYIGATRRGYTSVLGRGGSDYSGAVLARALGASVFERWTDIDGLYTDDPRRNPEARRLSQIAFRDALPILRAGGLGMHRQALEPLESTHTEVHVKSTLLPDSPGTRIQSSLKPG